MFDGRYERFIESIPWLSDDLIATEYFFDDNYTDIVIESYLFRCIRKILSDIGKCKEAGRSGKGEKMSTVDMRTVERLI